MIPNAFHHKFELVLKALSLSRGRLAADLKISKSLVSRWASGSNVPAPHNLIAVTELIAERWTGFSLLDWDKDLVAFGAMLGATDAPKLSVESTDLGYDADETLRVSRTQSKSEVQREGHAYPGVYIGFRQSFQNTGALIGDVMTIWRQGDQLTFRHSDPGFSFQGPAMILRNQLFCVGEESTRVDGLAFYVLNGVVGRKAIRIDGLVMTAAGNRFRTPTAAPVVFHRLLDLDSPTEPPPNESLAAILNRLSAMYGGVEISNLAGQDIRDALQRSGSMLQPPPQADYVLRIPPERSLSASEVQWSERLEADSRRLRSLLLGVNDCFAVYV